MENSISIILPFVIPRGYSRLFPLRTSIAAPSERAGTFAPSVLNALASDPRKLIRSKAP